MSLKWTDTNNNTRRANFNSVYHYSAFKVGALSYFAGFYWYDRHGKLKERMIFGAKRQGAEYSSMKDAMAACEVDNKRQLQFRDDDNCD